MFVVPCRCDGSGLSSHLIVFEEITGLTRERARRFECEIVEQPSES